MRNRILKGRPALLGVACLLMTGMLAGCGGGNGTYNPALIGGAPTPAASFTLALTPSSGTTIQGGTATYTATLTSVNGFSSPVSLSVSGLPSSTTGTFSPASVTPAANGAVSTLTLTTSLAGPGSLTGTIQSATSTPTGTYAITVTATGGGVTQQSTVTLAVTTAQPQ